MDQKTLNGYGILLLRLLTGVLFIVHAGLKYFVYTLPGTEHFFSSIGLPGWFGLFITALELFGGLALIAGIFTRIVSLLLACDLAGAIVLVHWQFGFMFDNKNGGWEFPFFWMVTMLAMVLFGDGPYALGGRLNRKPA